MTAIFTSPMKRIIFAFLVVSMAAFSCSTPSSKSEQPKPQPNPDTPIVPIKTNADFAPEVEAFEAMDKMSSPKKGGVLFIGTTAIRSCVNIAERLTDYPIIQRGLTDCETSNILHFTDKIITPYRPSILFIYNGEDDIVNGKTPEAAYAEFLKLSKSITEKLPDTKVCFVSVKPSPGRAAFQKSFEAYNSKVRLFITQQTCDWTYLDISAPLLNTNGTAKEDLFESDKITLNTKGYDVWEQAIKTYLEQ